MPSPPAQSERPRQHSRRWWLLALAAVAALVVQVGVPAAPASAYATTGCKWPTANVTIRTSISSSTTDYSSLSSAVYDWSISSDINMSFNGSSNFRAYLQNDGANGYAGWATWNCIVGITNGGDARMNPYYTNSYTLAKKQVVWLHEIAHVLGLAHVSTVARVMYSCPGCAYDAGVRHPTSDDVAGVNALY